MYAQQALVLGLHQLIVRPVINAQLVFAYRGRGASMSSTRSRVMTATHVRQVMSVRLASVNQVTRSVLAMKMRTVLLPGAGAVLAFGTVLTTNACLRRLQLNHAPPPPARANTVYATLALVIAWLASSLTVLYAMMETPAQPPPCVWVGLVSVASPLFVMTEMFVPAILVMQLLGACSLRLMLAAMMENLARR
jgi:hypothetical protein